MPTSHVGNVHLDTTNEDEPPTSNSNHKIHQSSDNTCHSTRTEKSKSFLKMKIATFKGTKKGDPDVHVQEFEHWDKIKGIEKEDNIYYLAQTLNDKAHRWYYHYPPKL